MGGSRAGRISREQNCRQTSINTSGRLFHIKYIINEKVKQEDACMVII